MLKKIKQIFIKSDWLEKLEKIFFSLFLLSIPLQTRLTFPTAKTYLTGTFNEYATFFIYLSDIFLLITFFIYFVNILLYSLQPNFIINLIYKIKKYFFTRENNKSDDRVNDLTKNGIFSLIINKLSTYPQLIPTILLSVLISWSFLSIFWAKYSDIALYRSFKLLEVSLFFVYLNKRFYWFGRTRLFVLVFISGVAQSIIGLLQYSYQHSLGLKLLGESMLAPNIDNVAKIIIDGEKVIRAYGTFPHPNIFSAFLILSIFSSLWLLLLDNKSEVGQIVSRETILNKAGRDETIYTKLSGFFIKLFHVKQFKHNEAKFWLFLLTFGIILQIIAFILTFARAAWFGFGLIIALLLFCLLNSIKIVSRETILNKTTEGEVISNIAKGANTAYVGIPKEEISLISTLKSLGSNIIYKGHTKLFHVKQFISNSLSKKQKNAFFLIIFTLLIITVFQAEQIYNRIKDNEQRYQQSLDSRVLYNDISLNIINKNLLLGIGSGNFTLEMNKYSPIKLDWWQYQPVHNIYLLIASEIGIIGLIIFVCFIVSIIFISPVYALVSKLFHVKQFHDWTFGGSSLNEQKNAFKMQKFCQINTLRKIPDQVIKEQIVSRETISIGTQGGEIILSKTLILSVLTGFLFMGLFDHYFWSFQQGQLMFWLLLGLLTSINNPE